MSDPTNRILDHNKIEQKINRMAYQIYEDHYDQKELILAGIQENGYRLAELIAEKLKEIANFKLHLEPLKINKKNPLSKEIELSLADVDLKGKCIIVVDDVLNSGKTMIFGINAFLKAPLKRLSVAVLVNRSHSRYPVKADYIGMSLSTTLQEHIEVDFSKAGDYAAYLS